jgi:hypothetical protein
MPYGRSGAHWALLGPGIELRRTEFDLDAACARTIAASGYPEITEWADYYIRARHRCGGAGDVQSEGRPLTRPGGGGLMAIRQTLEVINAMEADGVIDRYALAGAVAAFNYIDPAVTEDLDISSRLAPPNGNPGYCCSIQSSPI